MEEDTRHSLYHWRKRNLSTQLVFAYRSYINQCSGHWNKCHPHRFSLFFIYFFLFASLRISRAFLGNIFEVQGLATISGTDGFLKEQQKRFSDFRAQFPFQLLLLPIVDVISYRYEHLLMQTPILHPLLEFNVLLKFKKFARKKKELKEGRNMDRDGYLVKIGTGV